MGLMPEKFLVCVTWPYANSLLHLGHISGLYRATATTNHARVFHEIFLSLLKKGHIYKDTMPQPYCPTCKRSLPDRYVEGICPFCGYESARGDQCDRCGKPLNPTDPGHRMGSVGASGGL